MMWRGASLWAGVVATLLLLDVNVVVGRSAEVRDTS